MDHSASSSDIMSTPDTAVISRHVSTPQSAVTRLSTGSINKSLLTPCRRIGLGRPSAGSLKRSGQTGMFRSPAVSNENSPVTPRNATFLASSNRRLIISPLATRNFEDTVSHEKNELKNTPATSKINGHTVKNNVTKNNLNKQSGIKRRLHDMPGSKENNNTLIQEMETEKNSTETTCNNSANTENTVIDNSKTWPDSEETHLQESRDNKKQKLEVNNKILAEIAQRILKKKKQLEDIKIQETYARKNDLNTSRELTRKWRKAGQEALRQMLKMAGDMGYKVTLLELIQQYSFPLELIRYNTELEDFECDGFK